jgi:hypothetical protein
MTSLIELVEKGAPLADISAHLDALAPHDRVGQVRVMGHRDQEKLWQIAKGGAPIELASFVDSTEQTVIYEGKNTLPAFSFFQKRFWRPAAGDIVGYNHNGSLVSALSGPGYFLTVGADDGEILFDYTRDVGLQPPGWPQFKPNTALPGRLVFGGMKDYCRYVAKGTVIGAAFKTGKAMNQYFMLTRAAS